MKSIFIMFLFLLATNMSFLSQDIVWEKIIDNENIDDPRSIITTEDNACLVIGRTWTEGLFSTDLDVLVTKLDRNGNIIWKETYDTGEEDWPVSINKSPNSNYYITVSTEKAFWIIEIDSTGEELSDKKIPMEKLQFVELFRLKSDGGFIINGSVATEYGSASLTKFDSYIARYDKNYNRLWYKTFGGEENESINSMIETTDNCYVLAGSKESKSDGKDDFWIFKVDSTGNMIWSKIYGGKETDMANSIIETSDNKFIVVGKTKSGGNGSSDVWVVKLDGNGNKLWDKTLGNEEYESASHIINTNIEDEYLISGYRKIRSNFWIIKMNKDGNILGDKISFGGKKGNWTGKGGPIKLARTYDGNYVVCGPSPSMQDGGVTDIRVIKIKED